jgi:hypothetical protein
MGPQERFHWTYPQERSTANWKCRRISFFGTAPPLYLNSPPPDVFDDLHEIYCFTEVQSFHATVDFLKFEFRSFVNHYSSWGLASMAPTIQIH